VVEAPDELSATALNLSLSALGNIRTESLRAFSSAEMMNIVAKML
ncbi:MAG: GYD domain-containing protein, partial [Pseudolabrys sp.]